MSTDNNVTELSSFVKLNIGGGHCFVYLCGKVNGSLVVGVAVAPVSLPAVTTRCPRPSRIFHGRRNILDKMHQYFTKDIGQCHVCLLHGLGGSGKTQIALKFLDETDSARCIL
jgi:hypothetical protein